MCDTWVMGMLGRNIRYLLWREGIPKRDWLTRVAEWVGLDPDQAEKLLGGKNDDSGPSGVEAIAKEAKVRVQDLLQKDLLATGGVDILTENIRYLIEGLPHGFKKEFAATLEVDVTTVSRWRNGGQRPTRTKLGEIGKYFGIQPDIDLESDPVFLSIEPVSNIQYREWLHEKIDQLDDRTLTNLMPAFERLLAPRSE